MIYGVKVNRKIYQPTEIEAELDIAETVAGTTGKETGDRMESNLSKTKNIPPKAVIFSDFCCTFAMSLMIFACLDLQH